MRPELDLILWRGGVGKATARLSSPEGVARMRERIERFALFDAAEYLSLSPDLEGLDALTHYAEYGVWEPHRRFVGEKTIAAWLGEVSQAPLPTPEAVPAEQLARALADGVGAVIGVHVNRAGSWRSHDLGARLVRGLGDLGLHAELLDEESDPQAEVRRVFVAPHEFFTHGRGASGRRSRCCRGALCTRRSRRRRQSSGRRSPTSWPAPAWWSRTPRARRCSGGQGCPCCPTCRRRSGRRSRAFPMIPSRVRCPGRPRPTTPPRTCGRCARSTSRSSA
jgi:hypothetical protein